MSYPMKRRLPFDWRLPAISLPAVLIFLSGVGLWVYIAWSSWGQP